MTPTDIAPHLEKLHDRMSTLQFQTADPAVYADQKRCRALNRELQHLQTLFETVARWENLTRSLEESRSLQKTESDMEMQELIRIDIDVLENEVEQTAQAVQRHLVPPDPRSGSRIIIEIHPAAGGDEAALFTGELFRAYTRFAEQNHWKFEILSMTASDLGGVKDVVFSFSGETAYDLMRFESGVHRVQRIPVTESGGRIHTSTVTVSVLPEAEEVDIEIKAEDLRFDVFRSSGPGGQCVNTTDSAVRVTHIPSGLSVASQQEKSQHRNREIALRILRSRLLEEKQREEAEKRSDSKRAQVGTGDRSERIRTYNFPQSRCTDHRYGISVYDLPGLMEGNLTPLLTQLLNADAQLRLQDISF